MTTTNDVPKRAYGFIRDKRDHKEFKIKLTADHVRQLAKAPSDTFYDIRQVHELPADALAALSEIDQGQLGSCTGNATSYGYAICELIAHNRNVFLPARLFIYYNERLMEGTVDSDAGAQIVDGIKSLNIYGVCDEHHWIYDPLKFTVKPPDSVYAEAKLAKAVKYATIDFDDDATIDDRVAHLKRAIQLGFPIVFGFTVFESFESPQVASTGVVPVPDADYEQVMGGHAVCAIGFDDSRSAFIVKNSWGAGWGIKGYFYMPYDYIGDGDLASDFWILKQVTDPLITGFQPSDIHPDAINLNVPVNSGGVVDP